MRQTNGLYPVLLRHFGRLPLKVRHVLVGWTSPAYRIGTVAIIRDGPDRILLARHSYRSGWGLPGGMIGWREEPEETIVREIDEEIGLTVRVVGSALVRHRLKPRRVEFYYELWLDGCDADDAYPRSPEIEEVSWFDASDLPALERGDSKTISALEAVLGRSLVSPG
ncbi:MAG: NUDIX hydrolase [Actinomycetia bacterium]|nr:NUDIX hydrolase [Actinomycetes bacterium]MCP4958024.1 NUDIX hydrolase [Actinomycetes bacterium]